MEKMTKIQAYFNMIKNYELFDVYIKQKSVRYKADNVVKKRFFSVAILQVILSVVIGKGIVDLNVEVFGNGNLLIYMFSQIIMIIIMWLVLSPFAAIVMPNKLMSHFSEVK